MDGVIKTHTEGAQEEHVQELRKRYSRLPGRSGRLALDPRQDQATSQEPKVGESDNK